MGLATKYASLPGVGSMYGQLAQHFLTQDDVPASYKEYQIAKQENPKDPSVASYAAWQTKGQSDKLADAQAKWDELQKNWQKYNLPDPNSQDPADKAEWRQISEKTFGVAQGGQTINVDTKGPAESEKAIVGGLSKEAETLQQNAPAALQNLRDMRERLNSGALVGGGAMQDAITRGAQALKLAGVGANSGYDPLTQTQEYLQSAAQEVMRNAHLINQGGGRITDAQLKLAERMTGGDPAQTLDALQNALEIQDKYWRMQVDQHNRRVDKFSKDYPGQTAASDYWHIDISDQPALQPRKVRQGQVVPVTSQKEFDDLPNGTPYQEPEDPNVYIKGNK
jgi:hypothetical protein